MEYCNTIRVDQLLPVSRFNIFANFLNDHLSALFETILAYCCPGSIMEGGTFANRMSKYNPLTSRPPPPALSSSLRFAFKLSP